MKTPSIDIDALNFISPNDIRSYLGKNGWHFDEEMSKPGKSIWRSRTRENRIAYVLLPENNDAPDYSYRVYDLVKVVSVVEERSESEVFNSIRSPVEIAEVESRDVVNFSLKFENRFQREVLASKLGDLLTSFQTLVNALGQYVDGRPSAKGMIPNSILEKVQMSVVSTFEGSFGLRFAASQLSAEQLDVLQKPLVRESLKEFFDLLKVSDNNDRLKESLIRLRTRTASSYKRFLVALLTLEVDGSIQWGSPDSEMGDSIEISKETIQSALLAVNKTIAETPDEFEIIAEWIGGNKRTRKFEVKDIETNQTYIGVVAASALKSIEKAVISQYYKIRILDEPELNEITDEITRKFTLLDLEDLAADTPTSTNR